MHVSIMVHMHVKLYRYSVSESDTNVGAQSTKGKAGGPTLYIMMYLVRYMLIYKYKYTVFRLPTSVDQNIYDFFSISRSIALPLAYPSAGINYHTRYI